MPKCFRNRKTIKLLEEQIANQKIEIAQLSNAQTATPVDQLLPTDQAAATEEAIDENSEAAAKEAEAEVSEKPAQ